MSVYGRTHENFVNDEPQKLMKNDKSIARDDAIQQKNG